MQCLSHNKRIIHQFIRCLHVSSARTLRPKIIYRHDRGVTKMHEFVSSSILCFQQNSLPMFSASQRNYAKKIRKKTGNFQDDESSDESTDEEEDQLDDILEGTNHVNKVVLSLRVDSILKAGLGIPKKKIEKEFYASNVRLNEKKVLKKSEMVKPGDELDLVKGYSQESEKFIEVHRVIVKSIGNITGNGTFPVRMEVLKFLTIENYADDKWSPSELSL